MVEQLQIYWNWKVAVYLFIAGVSAGAFTLSALAYFLGKKRYEGIVRIGAYIAPFPVIVGVLFLITDLERPYLFWKLFFSFQPSSVMWLGTWLLTIFLILSFIHFYIWLPQRYDILRIMQRLPVWFDRLRIFRSMKSSKFLGLFQQKNFAQKQGLVAGLGMLIAVGVGIYTGVLLAVLGARPFWTNPLLPPLFLLSALKTGSASICLVGYFFKGFQGMHKAEIKHTKSLICSVDFLLMIFFLITLFLYMYGLYTSSQSSLQAVRLIMGGEFTLLFWVCVVGVGIILPFALEIYELIPHYIGNGGPRRHNAWISGTMEISILLGSFALRYVIVYAGQMSQIISS